MLIAGIWGLSDQSKAGTINKAARGFLAAIDTAIYLLLGAMYQIFFNVASADIFSSKSILGIYKRFQLIIGVYMVFQLAIIIIKGIFDVEQVSGSKNNEFIKRVIIALSMLTLLTPINIPNANNEFEKRVNNNGLLFGVLYSLQWRVLNSNTIGRLVLGSSATSNESANDDENMLAESATIFTNVIIKSFIKINLETDDESQLQKPADGSDNYEKVASNRMCDLTDEELEIYTSDKSSPSQLFGLVDESCDHAVFIKPRFKFTYMMFISGIIGAIFVVIIASFSVDVAIRSIKLAVLRILAPIPIILYIDPKGSKDSGFNSWLKTLIETYVELFIRLAVIYFVIYIIQDIIKNGLIINNASGLVGVFSVIFIFIGLLLFAKEAPKFIQSVLGLKSEPGSIFGKAFGRASTVAGIPGLFNAARIANKKADIANDLRDGTNKADRTFNKGKHIAAGLLGAAGGVIGGMGAVENAKGEYSKNARDYRNNLNKKRLENGALGSTMLGRMGARAEEMFLGETQYAKTTADIGWKRAQADALKDKYEYVKGKAQKDYSAKKQNGFEFKDFTGNKVTTSVEDSLDEFNERKRQAMAMGSDGKIEINGYKYQINDGAVARYEKALLEATMTQYDIDQKGKEIPIYDKDGILQNADTCMDAGFYQKNKTVNESGYKPSNGDESAGQWFIDQKSMAGYADFTEKSATYQKRKADHGINEKK